MNSRWFLLAAAVFVATCALYLKRRTSRRVSLQHHNIESLAEIEHRLPSFVPEGFEESASGALNIVSDPHNLQRVRDFFHAAEVGDRFSVTPDGSIKYQGTICGCVCSLFGPELGIHIDDIAVRAHLEEAVQLAWPATWGDQLMAREIEILYMGCRRTSIL
ncbi:MAG: hypothetical protein A2722_03300 [Candidatus Doudnabacteria bacterium RIFCSPHIGHO2_01_FULL_50_11]|uniref:Uncharacterized protein n=1 Tax=Candidatus Doudnabacteria bacterium RIFCSPHIGHO2_01_FULL_50_11 TaxID=1817828 RepID=A0A1F5PIN4_9BACT|nr:MAG: hypothetical protein A2722_03300 [Candidatus Doudnabacteria bacterium RIFCSPHIGHO2_01_FULL_50_11]HLC44514.1 hypothetical protein [Patescibacteria group bacterium]